MQPTGTVWTILVEEHLGIISVKFGQNPISNLRGEVVLINKRAQRALGRSPEEKVKGHSGAIYRGPLMLSTKYL